MITTGVEGHGFEYMRIRSSCNQSLYPAETNSTLIQDQALENSWVIRVLPSVLVVESVCAEGYGVGGTSVEDQYKSVPLKPG